jgi:NAD(P)-dependent dehydrogenase (short-subunit alcohol dehydrogenase family)
LKKKAALVTGASSGIGTAIALKLAGNGYSVMAAGRDAERTSALAGKHDAISTWTGDLDSSGACAILISACLEEFGRLDVLVNNAGIYKAASAEQTTDELWLQTIAVNLSVPFYLSREAIPHLRKTRGVILNIASDWGLVGGKQAVAYCASKGGIVLMSKAMALDHAHEQIRVNAICPGDVESPMLYSEGAARGLDRAAAMREANAASPTGRVTTANEVASLVLYLASDDAAQITGAAIPMDGGNSA